MKKFIQSYYTYILSMLYLFSCGAIFSCVVYDNMAVENLTFFIVLLGMIIISVIGIWAEIIGFIIHAAKKNDLNNKILWCFMIYLFNIFIIPYYNLKYVVKEEKLVSKILVFVGLLIVSVVGGFLLGKGQAVESNILNLATDDKTVSFELNGKFAERQIGEYDLYATDKLTGMNFGAFIYDTNEEDTSAEEIHGYRIDWIQSAREEVEFVDSYETTKDNMLIMTDIYYGKLKGEEFVYSISTIDAPNANRIISVIQIMFKNDYETHKGLLKNNILSVKTN